MYDIIKSVIESKEYELSDMTKKIDVMWVKGILTEEQMNALKELARNGASAESSVDLMEKFNDHEIRLNALEKAIAEIKSGNDESDTDDVETEEVIEDFIVGKWYYAGNKVIFDGEVYECIAPNGTPCVWSPSDFPTYWNKL